MEEKQPLLRKMEKSFKLIVTAPLEAKIRYLCSMFPDKEYSGTLFYTFKGSLKKGDLVISAKDFYLQDIGNATYTEFKNDATLVTYMIDNNLLDCCTGIMHSHNRMSAFFSGTDINTLESEGKDNNHFVSLIVNNKGDYTAMITSKVTERFTGKMISVHHTFNDHSFEISEPHTEASIVVEAYPLDIEVEGRRYTDSLNARIKTISEAKKAVIQDLSFKQYCDMYKDGDKAKYMPYNPATSIPAVTTGAYEKPREHKEPVQLQLFDLDDEDMGNAHCDKKVINDTLVQVITGDIFAPLKKIDLDIWKEGMVKIYDKRFGNGKIGQDDAWYIWITYMFEYLECTFNDQTLKYDEATNKMIWAFDMI